MRILVSDHAQFRGTDRDCPVRPAPPTSRVISEFLVLPLLPVWAFTSVRITQPFHLKHTIASFGVADTIAVTHTFETFILIATASMRRLAGYIDVDKGASSDIQVFTFLRKPQHVQLSHQGKRRRCFGHWRRSSRVDVHNGPSESWGQRPYHRSTVSLCPLHGEGKC